MFRFDIPRLIIPLGLFIIGPGFFLMKAGSGMPDASWLTMLPGCLIAGAGLGFTNTTVTNTITGSISSDRAGMAAGIDMSARLITFAIHIALMGLILSQGILPYLTSFWWNAFDAWHLQILADAIATGNLANLKQTVPALSRLDPAGDIVHAALVHGFGWVMFYGGLVVWILAAASLAIFGPADSAFDVDLYDQGEDRAHP